jgi:hypothetical protein
MEPESTNSTMDSAASEIFQKILQSEGERLRWQIEGLKASYFVFAQNFSAFRAIIEYVESPDNREKFVGIHQRETLTALQQNTMRHLHNFLAGAGTLIDHTRVLVERLYPEDHAFRREFQSKMGEVFGKSGPGGLVKGLRNWVLHRDILPVKFEIYLFTNRTQAVVLDIKELNSYYGWDARAKAFFASVTSDIRLLPVMREYHDQVERLYTWLGQRMSEVHAEAFKELADLQRRYQHYMPEGLKHLA